jgi:hypothetical protein
MRLTQADVSACRDAYLAHDSDAARLRAMLAAAHQDAPDDVVLDLCSQVALQRPLLAVHETARRAAAASQPPAPHPSRCCCAWWSSRRARRTTRRRTRFSHSSRSEAARIRRASSPLTA